MAVAFVLSIIDFCLFVSLIEPFSVIYNLMECTEDRSGYKK